jgi:hypothetical protein
LTAPPRRAQAAALLGAAILVGYSLTRIPWGSELFRRPRTPFDRSAADSVVPGYALLTAAATVIPETATVVARTEPPNPVQETYFHRFAISLLPRRRVLPSAYYGTFLSPDIWKDAQYMVVVGPRPQTHPGTLVLETPDGTVWRRDVQ